MTTIFLKKNRDRSLQRRHPWVFSGSIARVDGSPVAGDIVRVAGADGEFLGWGYFNADSKIQVRVLDWHESVVIDESWWRERLRRSIAARDDLPSSASGNLQRVVYAEADGLPGLIVDRYDRHLVVQVLTAGVQRAKAVVIDALQELLQPESIFERSDADARLLEGLAPETGPLAGESPERIRIDEGGVAFDVDVRRGHKTGFYIDQRENRSRVAGYASGRRVLDLFCYSGGFGIHSLHRGAGSVTFVDSSAEALTLTRANAELNGLAAGAMETVGGNVFDTVRRFHDEGRRFDLVVCDPPKFAAAKSQLPKAERAYKDVNLNAMRLLQPGGILATFSCSGAVGGDDFARILAWASIDAGRDIQILERLSQAGDHPINPCFPESEYLKGFICRVC